MLDRNFLLTLAFLMMLGSALAFTADFFAARSTAAQESAVFQLPRVVITGAAPAAASFDAARPA